MEIKVTRSVSKHCGWFMLKVVFQIALMFQVTQREGVQTLMEVCRGAPRFLQAQSSCQGTLCPAELLQNGLSLQIQVSAACRHTVLDTYLAFRI